MIRVLSFRLSEEDERMLEYMQQYFRKKGLPTNYSVVVRYALNVAYQEILADSEDWKVEGDK